MLASSIGAAVRSRSLTDPANAAELSRSGLVGLGVSTAALTAGVYAAFTATFPVAAAFGIGIHAAGACADVYLARRDQAIRQLNRPPSEVYNVDTLASATISVRGTGIMQRWLHGSYVEVRDTRPFGEGAFGRLRIGANYHDQSYRQASVTANADEIKYVRATAEKCLERFVDEPGRQAQFTSLIELCDAALAGLESSKT